MNFRFCWVVVAAMPALLLVLAPQTARAQVALAAAGTATEAASSGPLANFAEGSTRSSSKAQLTIGGYVEGYYQWNTGQPSNGITNLRAFDNRHASFTLQNVLLDASGRLDKVSAHLALQFGHLPDTYYAAEPLSPGASGANASGPNLWKYLQQANVSWLAPVGRGLTLDAGLFLSPIGPEGMAVKDQWNWSRSNLFFGLPFYHTGVRATYPLGESGTLSAMACNGWNSVVDNNTEKSVILQYSYNIADHITWNLLYNGGVERGENTPEGRAWRHMLDSYVALYPSPRWSLIVHANAGAEPNELGNSAWLAGALYARVQATDWLYLAARGDLFREWQARDASTSAAPIFWGGAAWITSQTLTADLRPADNLSMRLEYRHDQSDADLYFRGQTTVDVSGAAQANSDRQDTLTAGVTAWF
jgi:hypothetical protein